MFQLSAETKNSCVVIDYQDNSFSIIPNSDVDTSFYAQYERALRVPSMTETHVFKVVDIIEGSVSWNNRQRLYLYSRV
jgi:hypothetical protein